MKYRDHRGSLSESLSTQIEVKSLSEIFNHIKENTNLLKLIEIKLVYYGYDDRIGWDTWLVLCKYEGYDVFHVAGMTNGFLT